jgi:hypothetical protein
MPNFIISLHGRGSSYAFMLQGVTVEECVDRCYPCLQSGFEVFIYSIEPSPTGQPGFTPTGAVNLRRHFHLYAAHDEYEQEAHDIIERLSAHSVQASQEYLDIMIKAFQLEKDKLQLEPATGQ